MPVKNFFIEKEALFFRVREFFSCFQMPVFKKNEKAVKYCLVIKWQSEFCDYLQVAQEKFPCCKRMIQSDPGQSPASRFSPAASALDFPQLLPFQCYHAYSCINTKENKFTSLPRYMNLYIKKVHKYCVMIKKTLRNSFELVDYENK